MGPLLTPGQIVVEICGSSDSGRTLLAEQARWTIEHRTGAPDPAVSSTGHRNGIGERL